MMKHGKKYKNAIFLLCANQFRIQLQCRTLRSMTFGKQGKCSLDIWVF